MEMYAFPIDNTPYHAYGPEDNWGVCGFAETYLYGAIVGAVYACTVQATAVALAVYRRRERTTGSRGNRTHAVFLASIIRSHPHPPPTDAAAAAVGSTRSRGTMCKVR